MNNRAGKVLYIVRTWMPEDQREEWLRWQTEVHVPEVVSQPQIRSARICRVVEDNTPAEWPALYVTVYELDSLEDWESYNTGTEAVRLRKEAAELYGETGKISRQVLVEEVEVASLEDAPTRK